MSSPEKPGSPAEGARSPTGSTASSSGARSPPRVTSSTSSNALVPPALHSRSRSTGNVYGGLGAPHGAFTRQKSSDLLLQGTEEMKMRREERLQIRSDLVTLTQKKALNKDEELKLKRLMEKLHALSVAAEEDPATAHVPRKASITSISMPVSPVRSPGSSNPTSPRLSRESSWHRFFKRTRPEQPDALANLAMPLIEEGETLDADAAAAPVRWRGVMPLFREHKRHQNKLAYAQELLEHNEDALLGDPQNRFVVRATILAINSRKNLTPEEREVVERLRELLKKFSAHA